MLNEVSPAIAHRSTALALTLGVTLVGCAPDHSTHAVIRQVGDTTIVVNEAPMYSDTIVPELLQSWGVFEGPDDEIFSEIFRFAVGPDGRILVHDEGRGARWFNEDGSFGGYLARHGQGPREAGYLPALAISSRGRVALWDLSNRRLMIFGSNDSLEASYPAPARWASMNESSLLFDRDGALWFKVARASSDDGAGYPVPTFVRFDRGQVPDTIFTEVPPSPTCDYAFDATYRIGYWEDERAPWFPMLLTAMSPRGAVARACSDRSVVHIDRPDSSVLRVELPNREGVVERYEREFFAMAVPTLPPLPSVRPDLARVILPGDGRLWLWPTQPPEPFVPAAEAQRRGAPSQAIKIAEHGAFEVVDSSGIWLGTVSLPDGVAYSGFPTTPGFTIRGDTLWAVRTGELDEQYISKYVVRWPGGRRR